MQQYRAALHAAVDAFFDALENGAAPEERPPLAKVRASRRGAGLRMFTPTIEISPEARERAAAMARRKGI